ncbi:MAG: gamma carbonic anhydrase family protein [Myxococcota bacterium]|nr:gamma carbonic anhydrase family protein [Myxococcota bacterium]
MGFDDRAIVRAFEGCAPRIDPSAWLAPGSVVVGDVEIGADCSIWYGAVVRGDVHHIRIGPRTNVQDQSVLHVTAGRHALYVGAEVTIGHRAVVHGCRVHDAALIGVGAVVLDGAEVGEGALVAAGSVVTPGTVVPPRTLVLGTPARPIRELDPDEQRLQRERTLTYVETARSHAREAPIGDALCDKRDTP